MAIVVRYPGRACLLGEHCDWAGGASLTVPLPLWVELTVERAERELILSSEVDGRLLEGRWPIGGVVDPDGGTLRFVPAVAHELAARGIHLPPARMWGRATLPTGRGFSSSAAFTLAAADALTRHAGVVLPPEELVELAYVVEHDRLGVSCGRLDQVACAAGSPVFVRWPQSSLAPSDREQSYRVRQVEARGVFHLVVGAFGAPRDTAAILSVLNAHHGGDLRDRSVEEGVRAVAIGIATFTEAAERGARALESGDAWALGAAMDDAQDLYEDLWEPAFPALRAPRLRSATAGLRERGALGAKFSGAGGDGSVIALFAEASDAKAAVDWLESQRVTAWYTPLGET